MLRQRRKQRFGQDRHVITQPHVIAPQQIARIDRLDLEPNLPTIAQDVGAGLDHPCQKADLQQRHAKSGSEKSGPGLHDGAP
jgi:hypothetical protein